MNSTGKPINVPDSLEAEKRKGLRASRFFLPVVGLLVVGAAVLTLQLFPILYGILLPPMPPLPAGAVEFSHRNISYGVDEWSYDTDQRACEVVQFYVDKGGQCPNVPPCGADTNEDIHLSGRGVAACEGTFNFSMFTMRWIATISSDDSDYQGSVFQLSREVFWGGEIPPSMDDLVEQIELQQTATPASP